MAVLDDMTLYVHYRAYKTEKQTLFGNLLMPHNNFLFYICLLEDIFHETFEKYSILPKVLHNLIIQYKQCMLDDP